jgi:hypothetical protein
MVLRGPLLNWFLWWRVSVEEIEAQVRGYHMLSIWQSARGLAMLLFFATALVISALVLAAVWPALSYVDAGILAILAVLVHQGYRWAIVAAMVVWTLEKAVAITWSGMALNPLVAVLWWAVTMHVLWLAWRTEQVRAAVTA